MPIKKINGLVITSNQKDPDIQELPHKNTLSEYITYAYANRSEIIKKDTMEISAFL